MTLPSAAGVHLGVVGRDSEIDQVSRFVAGCLVRHDDVGARLLAITGPEGIGKTTIWGRAIEQLRAIGTSVLVARPAPEELQAAMLGLFDLFGGADADDEPIDPGLLDPDTELFARGRIVLSTLQRLAEHRPVVLAIDELHWLDPITVRTLRYALRRLGNHPVSVLATARSLEEAAATALVAPGDIEPLQVGPMSVSELRDLLEIRTIALTRPSLELLHQVSGGNPLHAIELAQSIDLGGDRLALAELSPLTSLMSRRLARLAPGVVEVVRHCAALGPASPATVESTGVGADALADAVSDGAVVVDDTLVVRCANPTLGTTALGQMAPADRRALHGRIAATSTDRDARARHLALSCIDRDAAVADELDDASSRAARRGAPGMSAELLAHSRRLTPVDDLAALGRRTVLEILRRAAAGEMARSLSMIDDLLAMLPPGRDRANLLTLRVALDFRRGDELLERALEEAGDDDALRGRVLDQMAFGLNTYRGALGRAEGLASAALAIARDLGDAELEVLASGTAADVAALQGRRRPELLEHAVSLSKRSGPRLGRWPDQYVARHGLWGGRLDEARRIFTDLAVQCQDAGIEFQRPFRLFDLALVELGAGRLVEAAELAGDGLASAGDAGNEQAEIWLNYPAGLVAAHTGADGAEAAASTLMRWGIEHDEPTRVVMGHHVSGIHELASGRAEEAFVALLDGVTLARQLGHRHPGSVTVLPDAVEAAIAAGHDDVASALHDELAEQAEGLGEVWVDSASLRARGLIGLHAADRSAPEQLGRSAAAFDSLGYRLDAARTLLLQGRALRRSGRRRAAASVLSDAQQRFGAMGASPWVRQAGDELDRVAPGRGTGELTPTENKIAALVADGMRNREIADSLFVSVATVEAHLTRTYRKLGIRSRTELARHIRRDD